MSSDKTEKQVIDLKLRAEAIRERFDGNARRPVVIEFAGMPKASKTTIVNEIHRFLKRCGFRTKVIVEKASVCPIRDKKDASFNMWTMSQTLCELLVDTQSPPSVTEPEVVIIDRGIRLKAENLKSLSQCPVGTSSFCGERATLASRTGTRRVSELWV